MSKITLLLFAFFYTAGAFGQVPVKNVRPSFTNTIGPGQSGGGTVFQGIIARGANRPSGGTAPTIFLAEAAYGQPFATAETLSPSTLFAANVLSNPDKTGVYDVLYPAGYRTPTGVTATRAQLTARATGGAFRYKWLLYGENGADGNGDPVVVNLFAETFGNVPDDKNPWFDDTDRKNAMDQIRVLRAALAHAPLNKELQLALLDIHHDLAVAEMQFANKRLAQLAVIRLGLDSAANTFVIDREIVLRRELVRVTEQAAAWYNELLNFEEGGVDPGEFSKRFAGAPFGRFIFVSRVPSRTQTETEMGYASAEPHIFTAVNRVATIILPGDNNDFIITGEASVPQSFRVVISEGNNAPSFKGDTLNLPVTTAFTRISEIKTKLESPPLPPRPLPGQPADPTPPDPTPFTLTFSPGNDGSGTASTKNGKVQQIIDLNPNGSSVFAGYKDFRTYLTVMGQLVQYKADLANLLALRSSSGDLGDARDLLTEIQGPDSNTYLLLKNLFPDTDFNSSGLDSTGVRAAFTLFESALADSEGVRGFVNGTSNALGLDPSFLLLVEKQAGESETDFDSYDLLKKRILASSGSGNNTVAVGALAVALEALGDPNRPTTGGGAIQAYDTFLTGFGQTTGEMTQLQRDYAGRFEEITGYDWNNGVNIWTPNNPNPDETNGELATANRTIKSIEDQNIGLKQILASLNDDVRKAVSASTLADGAAKSINDALNTYLADSENAVTTLSILEGVSAGAQNSFETLVAVSGATNAVAAATLGHWGGINALAQAATAVGRTQAAANIDEAGIRYQTKLSLVDATLTAQQTALEIGSLTREVIAIQIQIDSNESAVAQAQAEVAALLREVARLQANFSAQRAELASAYYADPIHFLRAESALINADAAFRRAQKWLFYTCRALEYKWQERFTYVNAQIGLADDIGSIFKARNALELRRIYQGMEFFNADRLISSPGSLREDTATVSLRDRVITPNPKDINRLFGSFPEDDGFRPLPVTGVLVPKVNRFRGKLLESATGPSPGGGFNPPFSITIDSTQLEIGQLLSGPKFTFSPNNPTLLTAIESGLYRDKIDWLAVHFVFRSGAIVKGSVVPAVPANNGIDGSMSYGGQTFFRTRIPPLPNRAPVTLVNPSDATIPTLSTPGVRVGRSDLPGEFDINTFRYFQNTNPRTSIFETFDTKQAPSLEFIFSSQSAEVPAVKNEITSTSGFQINDFKELSVATTELKLNVAGNQFKIDDLIDIEIVVRHRAYKRPQIKVPGT